MGHEHEPERGAAQMGIVSEALKIRTAAMSLDYRGIGLDYSIGLARGWEDQGLTGVAGALWGTKSVNGATKQLRASSASCTQPKRCSQLSEGDIVRVWFDSGGKHGATLVWGIVTSTGAKTFSVLWESGLRNRLKYAETKGVEREHNHGAVAVTRQVMRERGLISPDGKPCKTVLP